MSGDDGDRPEDWGASVEGEHAEGPADEHFGDVEDHYRIRIVEGD